jgi:hypothetical protein
VEALDRVLKEEWHPEPTDPAWLDIKGQVELEVATNSSGSIATLARRAALRVEVGAEPVVSTSGHTSSFALDTRPWFPLATELPYVVELHASLDGARWILLASADDGMRCQVRTIDIAWPDEIVFGFHHVKLVADVTFLRQRTKGLKKHCTFSKQLPDSDVTVSPIPSKQILATERRSLPAISFGLFDTRRSVKLPREANGVWTKIDQTQPVYDTFVKAAQQVRADTLEPGLPEIAFQQWLESVLEPFPVPKEETKGISWRTEFCNQKEAQWYPGYSVGSSYWPAAFNARHRRRDLCAVAGSTILEGNGPAPRLLTVRVRIGTLLEDTGEWLLAEPTFLDAFLESSDTLDVPTLSVLSALLRLPIELWPTTDISVTAGDISYTPRIPMPGEPVTVKVQIRNLGGRDVPFVHGTLDLGPCCPRERVLRDFHGSIPIGRTMTIEHTLVLPSGRALIGVCAEVWPLGAASATDRNTEDNCAGLAIGEPLP